MIYKICSVEDWLACQRDGRLPWSADDRRDAFIHLSAPHQLRGTVAKHFLGRDELMLLEVDPERLPQGALRWEVSRGGDRFPHLHADLPREAVVRAQAAPLGPDGVPRLPFGPPESPGELV
ncbi:MAG: DUF952 domain-containing protein [Myxococcales bacterium]|nr:DUF952 domain-containing protein [Myxococcales bacterium]MCB9714598.1 DUF952 domain-containing protein [Myxococcales bacterium]